MDEKRRTPRVNVFASIKLANSREAVQLDGFIENISVGGLGIVLPKLITVGTIFTCNFTLGSENEVLTPLGRTVHIKNDANSLLYYGLRFDHITERDISIISDYVNSHSHRKI